MGILAQAKTGILKKPMFITIHGTPKVGKTTFVSEAENPILIDVERGSGNINITRVSPSSFAEVVGALSELANDPHNYKTVGLDSLDHLEALVWKEVCRREGKASIEKVGGGYAKGYIEALKEWGEIIALLERCRDERGMNVICVAHSHIKSVNDPTQMVGYDRFEIKLHAKAAALFKEKSDVILFARQEVTVKEAANGKMRGVGTGNHVIHTNSTPAYEGGNRYGLPATLPLSYSDFIEAVKKGRPDEPNILLEQIEGLLNQVKDETTRVKARETLEKSKNDPAALAKILNRLKVLTKE